MGSLAGPKPEEKHTWPFLYLYPPGSPQSFYTPVGTDMGQTSQWRGGRVVGRSLQLPVSAACGGQLGSWDNSPKSVLLWWEEVGSRGQAAVVSTSGGRSKAWPRKVGEQTSKGSAYPFATT